MIAATVGVIAISILFVLPVGNPPYEASRSGLPTYATETSSASSSSEAAQASTDNGPSWFVKGETALHKGDLDAAEAAFRKVIAVDPKAGAAYSNLGVIAMRRKQWDRALTLLQKAEELEPAMPGIRLNIGLV